LSRSPRTIRFLQTDLDARIFTEVIDQIDLLRHELCHIFGMTLAILDTGDAMLTIPREIVIERDNAMILL
jgi:hypothetical protein